MNYNHVEHEAPGYRRFSASTFRDGLWVLIDQIPEVQNVLGVQDPGRAPSNPEALRRLIKHRHTTKQLPKGFSFSEQADRPVSRRGSVYGGPDLLIAGSTEYTIVLFWPNGLRVGLNFGDLTSRGHCRFFFRRPDSPVVVRAEGSLKF